MPHYAVSARFYGEFWSDMYGIVTTATFINDGLSDGTVCNEISFQNAFLEQSQDRGKKPDPGSEPDELPS